MQYTKMSTVEDLLINRVVEVELSYQDTRWPSLIVEGKVDTGADSCSIDESLASHLGWKVVGNKTVKGSLGEERREVYRGKATIRGVKFWLAATATDRSSLSHSLLVGHSVIRDLVELEEE